MRSTQAAGLRTRYRVAGTIDLAGKVVRRNKAIKVKGTFGRACPGLSACDFGDAVIWVLTKSN